MGKLRVRKGPDEVEAKGPLRADSVAVYGTVDNARTRNLPNELMVKLLQADANQTCPLHPDHRLLLAGAPARNGIGANLAADQAGQGTPSCLAKGWVHDLRLDLILTCAEGGGKDPAAGSGPQHQVDPRSGGAELGNAFWCTVEPEESEVPELKLGQSSRQTTRGEHEIRYAFVPANEERDVVTRAEKSVEEIAAAMQRLNIETRGEKLGDYLSGSRTASELCLRVACLEKALGRMKPDWRSAQPDGDATDRRADSRVTFKPSNDGRPDLPDNFGGKPG